MRVFPIQWNVYLTASNSDNPWDARPSFTFFEYWINISFEVDYRGNDSTLEYYQALLKNGITVTCKKIKKSWFLWFPYETAIFDWEFWALKVLPPPWPPGSKQCEIESFQKSTTCPCISRGCKVTGCQSFSTWKNKKCS